MSRNDRRVHQRSAQPARDSEDEGEDLRETEAMDEVIEGDMEADKLMAALKGGSSADVAEKLILLLETEPDNPQARALVKFFARKMYITSGGLPFNKEDPVPYKLDDLSNQELSNILENMILYTARSKQKNITSQLLNAVTNIAYMTTGTQNTEVINQIQSDETLRSAILDVFLGTKFSPLLTLVIGSLSHISNLARNYYDGKQRNNSEAGRGKTKEPTSSASSGVSSAETNKPSV